jgi:hypothetical protein
MHTVYLLWNHVYVCISYVVAGQATYRMHMWQSCIVITHACMHTCYWAEEVSYRVQYIMSHARIALCRMDLNIYSANVSGRKAQKMTVCGDSCA